MRAHEGRRETAEEILALLRQRLRDEADRYEPDREHIWSRVETAMRSPRGAWPPAGSLRPDGPWARPLRRWAGWSGLRVAATALGTAAVVGIASLTALALNDRTGPPLTERGDLPPQSPAQHASPLPVPSTAPGHTPSSPSSPQSASPAGDEPSGEQIVEATGTSGPNGTPYWGENTLKLRVHRPLTRLRVTIEVVRTPRVRPTGSWLSLATSDFRISTDVTGRAVVYRWTLLPGRTVRPGTYTFAAQYERAAGHDPGEDTFQVIAADGTRITGHF